MELTVLEPHSESMNNAKAAYFPAGHRLLLTLFRKPFFAEGDFRKNVVLCARYRKTRSERDIIIVCSSSWFTPATRNINVCVSSIRGIVSNSSSSYTRSEEQWNLPYDIIPSPSVPQLYVC